MANPRKAWTAQQAAMADMWADSAWNEQARAKRERKKPSAIKIDGFPIAELERFVRELPMGGVVVAAQSIALARAIENAATRLRGRPEGLSVRAWFVSRRVALERLRQTADPIRLAPGFSAEAFTPAECRDVAEGCFAELRALIAPEMRRAA